MSDPTTTSRIFAAALGLAAVLAAPAPPARAEAIATGAAEPTASATVTRLQRALVDAMKGGPTLGYEGRYALVGPVVRSTHYIPAIARLAVRRHWDDLEPEQQQTLVATFGELSVANYAARFDDWSGERFEVVGERESGKSTIVRSTLTKSDGEVIQFDYTLRRIDGRWRILNITVDGVSDLSLKRAEYGGVMTREGFDGLIVRMRGQIRDLESGDGTREAASTLP